MTIESKQKPRRTRPRPGQPSGCSSRVDLPSNLGPNLQALALPERPPVKVASPETARVTATKVQLALANCNHWRKLHPKIFCRKSKMAKASRLCRASVLPSLTLTPTHLLAFAPSRLTTDFAGSRQITPLKKISRKSDTPGPLRFTPSP